MSVYQTSEGVLESVKARLSGTSATAVVTAGNKRCTVLGLRVVNTGSGTPSITVDIYDGTTAYVQLQDHPLTADGGVDSNTNLPTSIIEIPGPIELQAGETLRVTSSVGSNAVHCTAAVTRPT